MTLEAFLARIYTDAAARRRFLAAPADEARRAGLGDADVSALARIDRAGLELFAAGLEARRRKRGRGQSPPPGLCR